MQLHEKYNSQRLKLFSKLAITSRAKTIFQMLCKNNSEWDEIVAGDIKLVRKEFLKYLALLNKVRATRFVYVGSEECVKHVQLHGFAEQIFI